MSDHFVLPQLRRASVAGFTLIELLVVLAIVALMMTLALPRYYGQLDATKESVLRENLRTTRDVLDKFYGDNGRFPTSLQELVDRHYLRGLPIDPVTGSSITWILIAPPDGYEGEIYDLRSAATGNSKSGKPYSEW